MKKIFRLFVFLLVLAAVGAGWLRDSPYWTLVEIQQGIEQQDTARVERVVALERFSASSTAALAQVFADAAGVNGTDPGSKLLNAIVGAIGEGVGAAVSKEGAKGLRAAIETGQLQRQIGPLEVNQGLEAVGPMRSTIDGALVEVKGTCKGSPATLRLVLERHEDGPFGGRPRRYVLVGVDPESARELARQCRAASTNTKDRHDKPSAG